MAIIANRLWRIIWTDYSICLHFAYTQAAEPVKRIVAHIRQVIRVVLNTYSFIARLTRRWLLFLLVSRSLIIRRSFFSEIPADTNELYPKV